MLGQWEGRAVTYALPTRLLTEYMTQIAFHALYYAMGMKFLQCDGELQPVPVLNAILRIALRAADPQQCKVRRVLGRIRGMTDVKGRRGCLG